MSALNSLLLRLDNLGPLLFLQGEVCLWPVFRHSWLLRSGEAHESGVHAKEYSQLLQLA